jgi:hypothetical protein
MRNLKRILGCALVCTLLLTTAALGAPRTGAVADKAPVRAVELRETSETLTVQRLLRERLRWALRLSELLETLDASEPVRNSTQTIVDEPDPTGVKPPEDPELPGTPEPIERDEDDNEDDDPQEIREIG